jgi:SNF2 family DNA or RNA helicase
VPPRAFIIPKAEVDKFVKRERDDYRPWKKLTNKEIDELAAKLPSRPPSKLWKHMRRIQRICFLIGAMAPGHKFALYCDTGVGKTLAAISIALYAERRKAVYRTLVLVPRKVNKAEWARELRKHVPDVGYVVLNGSSANKWKQLEEADDEFVIETYAGLVRMVTRLKEPKPGQRKKKDFLQPNVSLVNRLLKSIDGLICDEPQQELANKTTLAWRVCRKIGQNAGMLIQLTGTPFGRDPTPLWSQMYLVDEGHSLGENLGIFRAAFFKTRDNYWSGFPEFVFDKKKDDLLHRFIAHRSIRFEANEADLPKAMRITKELTIAPDVRAYYDAAKEQLIKSHGDEVGERAQIEFPDNPKLDMLLGLVEGVYEQHKSVVFHDFNFSGSLIARELKKLKIPFAWVYGKTKDSDAELNRFVSDDDCRVFLMSSAGSAGLNLQIAKYLFFFESPVAVITRKQTERRVERQYSEHDVVFLYDLVARGTYDEKILRAHAAGYDLFKSIIDGKERP